MSNELMWKARANHFEKAVKDIASGHCCKTPGCNTNDPHCDVMFAKQTLEGAPKKPKAKESPKTDEEIRQMLLDAGFRCDFGGGFGFPARFQNGKTLIWDNGSVYHGLDYSERSEIKCKDFETAAKLAISIAEAVKK